MKYFTSLALALAVARATPSERSGSLPGIDVSNFQPIIDWRAVVENGIQFAYVKATEGKSFVSPTFLSQYDGAASAGLIRGAYHAAHPDESSGVDQANLFLENGGKCGWLPDGVTLPGVLSIQDNPYGAKCYGLPPSQAVSWIKEFSDTYKTRTGRYPVINVMTEWWAACTSNSSDFAETNPLWLSLWASDPGPLPAGWKDFYFWQYNSTGPNPGDADIFKGDADDLKRLALGT